MATGRRDFDGSGQANITVGGAWGLGLLHFDGSRLTSSVAVPNGTRCNGWLLNSVDNRFDLIGDFDGDGRAELLVTSPWGIALLKKDGAGFSAVAMAANGTRFDGWLLNTVDNRFGPIGDFDGDGCDEVLVTSPWGIGILKFSGSTFAAPLAAANGTRFGDWLLDTADNRFSPVGDLDGDGRDELLVTSPWGIGVLALDAETFIAPVIAGNGTRLGEWLLDTGDNHIAAIADLDGDGRAEVVLTSPWGIGVLGLSGCEFVTKMLAPNGTRFDGWLLDTLDDRLIATADFDGDGHCELFVTSPWGVGLLKFDQGTFTVPMRVRNGTRIGDWPLDTADNRFDAVADITGNGRADLLVTSPWGMGILGVAGRTMTAAAIVPNGTRIGGWLLDTAGDRFEVGEQTVRLHLKVLSAPHTPIEQMMQAMQRVYEAAGLRVHHVSTETLSLPNLNDVDVGACASGCTTGEQIALFDNRNHAWGSDVVVYFVRSTIPSFNGCAKFPAGRPGAVVSSIATPWTLGHEVGHVLGLHRLDDCSRLMTGGGSSNFVDRPPRPAATQAATLRTNVLSFSN